MSYLYVTHRNEIDARLSPVVTPAKTFGTPCKIGNKEATRFRKDITILNGESSEPHPLSYAANQILGLWWKEMHVSDTRRARVRVTACDLMQTPKYEIRLLGLDPKERVFREPAFSSCSLCYPLGPSLDWMSFCATCLSDGNIDFEGRQAEQRRLRCETRITWLDA